jgi:hypothetical protein
MRPGKTKIMKVNTGTGVQNCGNHVTIKRESIRHTSYGLFECGDLTLP